MTKIEEAVKSVTGNIYNPNAALLPALNTLLDYSNDKSVTVLDPNNPVAFVCENSAIFALASAEHHEKALMKAYPAMATNREELYHHMTDKDFDVYAYPGNSSIILTLSKEELRNKAVQVGNGNGQLVIPKDTEFSVGGFTFTMQYPIIIDVMDNGGFQLRYDSGIVSPIRPLTTNLVEWEEVTVPINNVPTALISITIPLLQYKITTYQESLIPGRSFKKEYRFEDRFFLIRAFVTTSTGWKEIKVTHSNQVIDSLDPTVQITVKEDSVAVYLPDIYVRNGLVDGDVRVDLYTTKGNTVSNLSTFNGSQFSMTLRDIGGYTKAKFFTPIKVFSLMALNSNSTLDGGRDEVPFLELREDVINNAVGESTLIVSEKQLENALEDRGLALNKHVDYVTERLYHAISIMPDSSMTDVSEPVGAISAYLTTNFESLEELDSVKVNGSRVTLTPDTLYSFANGETIIAANTVSQLKLLAPEQLALTVNSNRFLYSPYHYVLDDTDSIIDLRAYYLKEPTFYSKRFVEYNQTIGIDLTIGNYAIEAVDGGYRIIISTISDDVYKEVPDEKVGAQLLFQPTGYSFDYAHIDGVMRGINADGERVFEFFMETNLDIDKVDNLIVTNFYLNSSNPTPQAMALDVDLNIILYVNNVNAGSSKPIEADNLLKGKEGDQAVTHEILKLRLGVKPVGQWVNASTIAGSIDYALHPEDVFLTHEIAILERDENNLPVLVDGDNGKEVVILFKRGDKVVGKDGEFIVKYPKGSPILDGQGNPVIANPRGVEHRLELMLLDAKYIFANTDAVKAYLDLTIKQIIKDAVEEIPSIQSQLLERTSLYVYPKNTIGDIEVKFDANNAIWHPSELDFKLKFYVTAVNRRDSELTKTLARTARSVIHSNLKKEIFSVDSVLCELKGLVGEDIEGVVLEPFGPDGEGLILSAVKATDKPTIAKRLIVNADKSIGLKDKITVTFVTR